MFVESAAKIGGNAGVQRFVITPYYIHMPMTLISG